MENIIFKTLLHSLWQGLVLALLTAAVLIFTSKSSARLRYNLLISCLVLFSVAIFASFIYEWRMEATWNAAGNNGHNTATLTHGRWPSFILPGLNGGENEAIATVQQPWIWMQKIWSFFNSYATTIVLIWLLVISAKSIQLLTGLYSIKRIRNTKITAAGQYWDHKVQELSLQFGIPKLVKIVQSGLVNVPMVVGYFKPLILIPIGLLNNLSKEEVEAIICHELAHVKRRDYLVNILQSVMELLFFFNPAVTWISGLIREERESCCDDLAVLNTNNKAGYIRALVSFEEFQMNKPEYAMGIAEHPNQLVKRVKRMVSNDRPTLSKMEQRLMAVALVAVLSLSMAFSSAVQRPVPSAIQENNQQSPNTIVARPINKKISKTEQESSSTVKKHSVLERMAVATQKVLIDAGKKIIEPAKTKTVIDRAESKHEKSTITRGFVSDDDSAKRYNEKTHDRILDDLIKDHLVGRYETLSFEMNKDQFLLKGEELPEEIRKRYANKYIKSPDWIISYKQEFESNH
ncbi:M56 family metallopeptidase [Pedobacter gandavensis]|uniref:M56 family metallopeptidase n=1 Tax=Pedobacter gandavensis TaxID=2679963 RepID=UPI00292D7E7E|nr:M56 family metallopeptidase [Pedobacter gandavensis]